MHLKKNTSKEILMCQIIVIQSDNKPDNRNADRFSENSKFYTWCLMFCISQSHLQTSNQNRRLHSTDCSKILAPPPLMEFRHQPIVQGGLDQNIFKIYQAFLELFSCIQHQHAIMPGPAKQVKKYVFLTCLSF